MAEATTIKQGNRTFEVEGALSYKVNVVASTGTVEAKKGHLIALLAAGWTAYAVGTDATSQTGIKAIGVLLEDASLSTVAKPVQVLYAGKVWEQFVRDAGITETVTSFEKLISAPGKIVFANEEVR